MRDWIFLEAGILAIRSVGPRNTDAVAAILRSPKSNGQDTGSFLPIPIERRHGLLRAPARTPLPPPPTDPTFMFAFRICPNFRAACIAALSRSAVASVEPHDVDIS